MATASQAARYQLQVDPTAADTLCLRLGGAWSLYGEVPPASELHRELSAREGVRRLVFDTDALTAWDSRFLTFLHRLDGLMAGSGIEADPAGLPEGVRRLLRLAAAVPERSGARREASRESFLTRVGKATVELVDVGRDTLAFLGEVTLAVGRLIRGKARFRASDFWQTVQEVGADALPIVGLISFLVGVILAFLGAVQLLQFGAQVYVAALVGIGMARDMAAMMVGIILAGRTGAAFAAEIGTMQVNEEVDALATFGFAPMDFLVLPRMLALVLMTPLLVLYANLLGILGGAFVGVTFLDLPLVTYMQGTVEGVRLIDFAGGLIKGAVYGAVVAVCGCMRGIQCGRSSAAVGQATTSAVVTSIIVIVVAMAILTVIYNALGI